MDFIQFEYLLKIAELGNFTKSAEELHMTQPALSHFIAKLEKREGVRIFDRSASPVKPTYAGEFHTSNFVLLNIIQGSLKRTL